MPSDTVLCAAEVAPGKACGHGLGLHSVLGVCYACPDTQAADHSFSAGRQCQTCGGERPLVTDPVILNYVGATEPFTFCLNPRCIGGVERIVEAVDE